MSAVTLLAAAAIVVVACSPAEHPEIVRCSELADDYRQRLSGCCNELSAQDIKSKADSVRDACNALHDIPATEVKVERRDTCFALSIQAWDACTELSIGHISNHVCNTWVEGLGVEGSACAGDEECTGGSFCDNGTCTAHLPLGSDCSGVPAGACGPDAICTDGTCTLGPIDNSGPSCGMDSECASGHCVDESCAIVSMCTAF